MSHFGNPHGQSICLLERVTARITTGGALLDDQGQQIGSILIIDVPDRAAAEEFAATDPFVPAGLFASTHIAPFRQVFRDGARSLSISKDKVA